MTSEDKRTVWMVKLPGRLPFAMAGERSTHAEALLAARVIWPEAEVIK